MTVQHLTRARKPLYAAIAGLLMTSGASAVADEVAIEPFEWGEIALSGTAPADEKMSVAVFVGTGDQGEDGQPTAPRQTYLDNLQFMINGSSNLLANGNLDDLGGEDFDARTPFPDDDQGPFGWGLTDLDEDGGAAVEFWPNNRSALEDMAEPVAGDRAFKFRYVDDSGSIDEFDDIDDDNLERCIDISDRSDNSLTLTASFQTNQPSDIFGVVSGEFFTSYDNCLAALDDDPLRNGALVELTQNEWVDVSETFTANDNSQFMRVSLRAGEQGDDDPDTRILIDEVHLSDSADQLFHDDFSTPERAYVLNSEAPPEQCDSDLEDMCDGQLISDDFPSWTFLQLGEQFILTGVSDLDFLTAEGNTVARFSEQDNGITGENDVMAQCVDLSMENTSAAEFTFLAHATSEFPRQNGNGELPVELALKFYASDDCDDEINEDFDEFSALMDDDNDDTRFQRTNLVSSVADDSDESATSSSSSSSSFGCTLGNNVRDPLLPALAVLAMLALVARRRRWV